MTRHEPVVRVENLAGRLGGLPITARYRLRRALRRLQVAPPARRHRWAA
jgi:hypothetical protein